MVRPLNAAAADLIRAVDLAEGRGVVVDAGVAADEAAAADGEEVVDADALTGILGCPTYACGMSRVQSGRGGPSCGWKVGHPCPSQDQHGQDAHATVQHGRDVVQAMVL
jgi:hypothetical protein